MAVPYYIGYMGVVVDNGQTLHLAKPREVYSPEQAEAARKTDKFLGQQPGEYGTLRDLPHILVGSTTFNGTLEGFQLGVSQQMSGFRSGQLKELEDVFRKTKPFEVLPTSG